MSEDPATPLPADSADRRGSGATALAEDMDPRKAHIMAVTERLLSRRGYEGLRLRDVSKEAGVSVGSIQHWFDTRDALVFETLSSASWRRAAEFVALQDGLTNPVMRVHALLRGSIADKNRCQTWLETCASSTRHAELVPMIERIYDAWRAALQQALTDGVAAGAFVPLLPIDEIVDNIMVMIDGLMVAVSLNLYQFDAPYVVKLVESTAGRLLGYDFAAIAFG